MRIAGCGGFIAIVTLFGVKKSLIKKEQYAVLIIQLLGANVGMEV